MCMPVGKFVSLVFCAGKTWRKRAHSFYTLEKTGNWSEVSGPYRDQCRYSIIINNMLRLKEVMSTNWKVRGSIWTLKNTVFTVKMTELSSGPLESPPWRPSKATRMWSWAPCSGCPYWGWVWATWPPEALPISNHSNYYAKCCLDVDIISTGSSFLSMGTKLLPQLFMWRDIRYLSAFVSICLGIANR